MTTRRDIGGTTNYQDLPRVDAASARMLWHIDYWDGPKSGILVHQGLECWFEQVEENEDESGSWYRRYIILRLAPEQLAEERRWHDLFREKVGTHTDYDKQGRRPGRVKPEASWQEFYEPYKKRLVPDYGENEVLGWFQR